MFLTNSKNTSLLKKSLEETYKTELTKEQALESEQNFVGFFELLYQIDQLKALNRFSSIPFQKVLKEKMKILTLYFQEEEKNILSSNEFQHFTQNNEWIKPYALFKVLKEKQNHSHFSLWPEEWKNLSKESFDSLFEQFLQECCFYITLQYLCFSQLRTVKKEAEEQRVYLKAY